MSYNRYDEPHTRRELGEAEPGAMAEGSVYQDGNIKGLVVQIIRENLSSPDFLDPEIREAHDRDILNTSQKVADLFDAVTRQRDQMQAEIDRLTAALVVADEYLTNLQTPQSYPLASLNYPMKKADRNKAVAEVRNGAREIWAVIGNVLHHGMTVEVARAALKGSKE